MSMILGIGTDIVAISRIENMLTRHGERLVHKILSPQEQSDYQVTSHPARLIAKRFAAKEAFVKALGTGLRTPLSLPAISIAHDALGKPFFDFSPVLQSALEEHRVQRIHLSISDEAQYAVAFVIIET